MVIIPAEYTAMVKALFKIDGFDTGANATLHAAVGISGEAGEILDVVKKTWAYNKPLDHEHLTEELGDLEFYLEALYQATGISRTEALRRNRMKLAARYPAGVYSDADAQLRADKGGEDYDPVN